MNRIAAVTLTSVLAVAGSTALVQPAAAAPADITICNSVKSEHRIATWGSFDRWKFTEVDRCRTNPPIYNGDGGARVDILLGQSFKVKKFGGKYGRCKPARAAYNPPNVTLVWIRVSDQPCGAS